MDVLSRHQYLPEYYNAVERFAFFDLYFDYFCHDWARLLQGQDGQDMFGSYHVVPQEESSAALYTSFRQRRSWSVMMKVLLAMVVFAVAGTSMAMLWAKVHPSKMPITQAIHACKRHKTTDGLDCLLTKGNK